MITFFHVPHSRSSAIQWLLAELDLPHETRLVDGAARWGVPARSRSIEIHGAVPAIVHDGVTITERAAIALHLADAFPRAGLAPALGDRRRGPYLSWLTYVDAVLDPAISAHLNGWAYEPRGVAFGTLADALARVERGLSAAPYLLGERFTAADVVLGSALHWGLDVLGAIPDRPAFRAYLGRLGRRPAFHRTIGNDPAEDVAEAA